MAEYGSSRSGGSSAGRGGRRNDGAPRSSGSASRGGSTGGSRSSGAPRSGGASRFGGSGAPRSGAPRGAGSRSDGSGSSRSDSSSRGNYSAGSSDRGFTSRGDSRGAARPSRDGGADRGYGSRGGSTAGRSGAAGRSADSRPGRDSSRSGSSGNWWEPGSSAGERAGSRPARSDDRGSRSYERPARSDDRPTRSYDRPARSDDRGSRSYERPARSEDRPTRSYDRPARSDDRGSRSYERPARSEDRPTRSYDRPARSEDRPTRSYDRDSAPRSGYSRDARPARDDHRGSRDDRPARGSDARGSGRGDARGGHARPPYSDDRSASRPARYGSDSRGGRDRRAEQEDYELTRGSRPTRGSEIALPKDADPKLLDASVRAELRSLSKLAAEFVGAHLVAAGQLIDDDPKRALEHARAARGRGARVAAVREATGLAAYHAGEWAEALSELRAARRMSGDSSNIAVMADCERALGRPERALKALDDPAIGKLDPATRGELLIVVAGARRDLGQVDAALAILERGGIDTKHPKPGAARLWYAYADALAAAGRTQDAIQWFGNAATVDFEDETDAADRAAALL